MDEVILQVFEEQEESFHFPVATQKEARAFVKALHGKGFSYDCLLHEIKELEQNFSAWRKGISRPGIGNRVIERINRPLQQILHSDGEEEDPDCLDQLSTDSDEVESNHNGFEMGKNGENRLAADSKSNLQQTGNGKDSQKHDKGDSCAGNTSAACAKKNNSKSLGIKVYDKAIDVTKDLSGKTEAGKDKVKDSDIQKDVPQGQVKQGSSSLEIIEKKKEAIAVNKQAVTEKKEEAVAEKKHEKATEKKEEAVTEKKQEAVTEKKQEAVTEKKEEAVPEKKHEEVMEKKQEAVTEKKQEAVTEKKQEAVPEKKHEEVTEKKQEAVTEKKQEGVTEKKQEAVPEKKHEEVTEKKQEAVTEKKQEAVAEKKLEAVTEKKQEAVTEMKQEAVMEKKQEAVAEKKLEAVTEKKQEAVTGNKQEAVTEKKQEAVMEKKQEAVAEKKLEAVTEKKQEAVTEKKQEAVMEKKQEAVAEKKLEAVTEKKQEAVTGNKQEAVIENKQDTVTEKKQDAVLTNNQKLAQPVNDKNKEVDLRSGIAAVKEEVQDQRVNKEKSVELFQSEKCESESSEKEIAGIAAQCKSEPPSELVKLGESTLKEAHSTSNPCEKNLEDEEVSESLVSFSQNSETDSKVLEHRSVNMHAELQNQTHLSGKENTSAPMLVSRSGADAESQQLKLDHLPGHPSTSGGRRQGKSDDILESYDSDFDDELNHDAKCGVTSTGDERSTTCLKPRVTNESQVDDHAGYVYVFTDSSAEPVAFRVKVGASRFPHKKLQQSLLFNVDMKLVSAVQVSDRRKALDAVHEKLTAFSIPKTVGWFCGPLESILTILMAVAKDYPHQD